MVRVKKEDSDGTHLFVLLLMAGNMRVLSLKPMAWPLVSLEA
ncbi:hypothetical protein [Anoxybacillus sp. UARK-01]|nr:hypothetical protein [Anoxybacillus sp. UARK-01]